VFSSPAQANNASSRRVSPIYKDRVGGASVLDESPTRRRSLHGSAEPLVPFPSHEPSSASLRAEKPLPPLHHNPSTTATPSKSSITKRRLNGPRLSGSESPTATKQAKTVTFQAVPDVKEFETESVTDHGDKSRDSDADMDDVDLGDGADFNPYGVNVRHVRSDGRGGVSGITELHDQTYDDQGNGGDSHDPHDPHDPHDYESSDGHGVRSVDSHASDGGYHRDESMTANFIDSLVEDGYFSPPAMQTATLPNQIFDTPSVPGETPVLNSFMDFTPKLETPSFGSSLGFSTPAMENPPVALPHVEQDLEVLRSLGKDDREEYGRAHLSERVALAPALPIHLGESMEQPALPKPLTQSQGSALQGAEATRPSLPVVGHDVYEDYPRVQQDGAFVDPFVTVQTATQAHNQGFSGAPREQDALRTGHNERSKVARLLATQSLGLGLPNHPKQPSLPSTGLPAKRYISYGESEDGSEEDESDDERMPLASVARPPASQAPPKEDTSDRRPLLSQKLEQLCSPSTSSAKRALPKPPQPQQLDIPSPKLAPALLPLPDALPRSSSPTVSRSTTPMS
jgi:serine/arginine repetitive matrix protein 2